MCRATLTREDANHAQPLLPLSRDIVPFLEKAAADGAVFDNLTDDNVLNKDVVVVWQQGGGSKFDLGQTKVHGETVGIYQLRDTVTGKSGYDGGQLGQMPVRGFGRPGEKGVMACALVSIRPDAAELTFGQTSYVPITAN